MGNAESNVTSGIKRQAEASSCELYKLMDLKGRLSSTRFEIQSSDWSWVFSSSKRS